MFKSKIFWYLFIMPGALLGWLFIIYGFVCPINQEAVHTLWLIITGIWVITHPLELILSIPIGKKAGISTGTTIIKTLLFGFTWWVPVKMGVLDK